MDLHSVITWTKPRVRYFTRGVTIAAFGLVALRAVSFIFAKEFAEVVSHYLHLTFQEAVVIAMFMALLERVVVVQHLLERHLRQTREVACHKTRVSAYDDLCQLVRERAAVISHVDLIQFSGSTAVSILQTVARECPTAVVRLFLYDPSLADAFDAPGFHANRIVHTLTVVKTLKEDQPNLDIKVWLYSTMPSMAAVVIDNWGASVGWYRVFPNPESATGQSIRSHSDPNITVVDGAVEPLRSMVERQLSSLLTTAKPAVADGATTPKASAMADPLTPTA